jgi:hypothetical protein
VPIVVAAEHTPDDGGTTPHAVPYDQDDGHAPAEGKEDPRIIRALNERPKVVFSTTLDEPGWANTQVVASGVEDEIRRLKHEPGGAICVQAAPALSRRWPKRTWSTSTACTCIRCCWGTASPCSPGGHVARTSS